MNNTINTVKLDFFNKKFTIEIHPNNCLKVIGDYDMEVMKRYYPKIKQYLAEEGFLNENKI